MLGLASASRQKQNAPQNASRMPSAAYLRFVQAVSKEITKPTTAIQVVKKT